MANLGRTITKLSNGMSIKLAQWMVTNKDKLVEKGRTFEEIARLAEKELLFKVTKSHIKSTAKCVDVPLKLRGATAGTRRYTFSQQRQMKVLANFLLSFASGLNFPVPDEVKGVLAELENANGKPASES